MKQINQTKPNLMGTRIKKLGNIRPLNKYIPFNLKISFQSSRFYSIANGVTISAAIKKNRNNERKIVLQGEIVHF